jgi:hypothetical protein
VYTAHVRLFERVREFELTILHQREVEEDEFEEYTTRCDKLIASYTRLKLVVERWRVDRASDDTSAIQDVLATVPTLMRPAVQKVLLAPALTQPAVQDVPTAVPTLMRPAVQEVLLAPALTQPAVQDVPTAVPTLMRPAVQEVLHAPALTQPAVQEVPTAPTLMQPRQLPPSAQKIVFQQEHAVILPAVLKTFTAANVQTFREACFQARQTLPTLIREAYMSHEVIESITTILYKKNIISRRHNAAWAKLEDNLVFDAVLEELRDYSTSGTSMTDRLFAVIDKINYPAYNPKSFPQFISLLRGALLQGLRQAGKLGADEHDTEETLRQLTDHLCKTLLVRCNNSPFLQQALEMIKQSSEYLNNKNPMIFSTFFDRLTDQLKGLAKTADFIERYGYIQATGSHKRDRDGQKKGETTISDTPSGQTKTPAMQ